MVDGMDLMGQSVDPFDLIQHHMDNLGALRAGRQVRDLAESAAGFDAAISHLRGAVSDRDALARELHRDHRAVDAYPCGLCRKTWERLGLSTTPGGQ